MPEIKYSDDPNNPLNMAIADIAAMAQVSLSEESKKAVRDKCRKIYEFGFEDGEHFVWQVRHGGNI